MISSSRDVAVVLVHLLDVTVDDFECNQLVILGRAAGDEEERGVSTVHNLCVSSKQSSQY